MEFLAYIEVVLELNAVIHKVVDHTAMELIMVDLSQRNSPFSS